MAVVKKSSGKKAKRVKKAAPKKRRATRKKKKEVEEDPNEPLPAKSVRGRILWEYRAYRAEWMVAYGEGRLAAEKYKQEITDADGQVKPKYKELLDLIALDRACREEIRMRGRVLSAAQQRIADKLGITQKEFVKDYTIDVDTGAVTYLGVE